MSQNIDKNMTSLSKQVENVSNLQQQLQEEQEQQRQALQQQQQTLAANESSSYKAVSEKEDVPLLVCCLFCVGILSKIRNIKLHVFFFLH